MPRGFVGARSFLYFCISSAEIARSYGISNSQFTHLVPLSAMVGVLCSFSWKRAQTCDQIQKTVQLLSVNRRGYIMR